MKQAAPVWPNPCRIIHNPIAGFTVWQSAFHSLRGREVKRHRTMLQAGLEGVTEPQCAEQAF